MTTTTMETKINSNARSSYPAYYAAEAGLEEATYRMRQDAVNALSLSNLDAPSKVVYIRQDSSIDPTSASSPYYDTEFSSSSFTTVNYTTTNQSSNPIPYQWVKISMKTKRLSGHDVDNTGMTGNQDVPVYYNGAQYLFDVGAGINPGMVGLRVYQITSFCRLANGATSKLRREISSAAFPGLPGAVFFNGPNPGYSAPTSNNFRVEGADQAGGPAIPAIAVASVAADTSVTGAIPANRLDHYTGSGPWPDVQNVTPNLPTAYTTPQGIEDMVSLIAASATATYPAGTTTATDWGTAGSPVINVFEGDCNLGNGTGYGVLVVRGNFYMEGNGSFHGLLLIVGQGTVTFDGGGNGQINGGVFVAKTQDAAGNVLASLGSATINWSGGGSNGIRYNSALANNLIPHTKFIKLTYKEMSE